MSSHPPPPEHDSVELLGEDDLAAAESAALDVFVARLGGLVGASASVFVCASPPLHLRTGFLQIE